MPVCGHCLRYPIFVDICRFLLLLLWIPISYGNNELYQVLWKKNKLKKSPAVAVTGRTVVGLVGLLKSSTMTNSRLWHHRFSSWLSTKLLLFPLSSVLLLSLLSSAEISLSPDISALHDISSTVKPKKLFFTISVAFKNISNSHHMPESVCSSDLNFQKFTLYRPGGLGSSLAPKGL